MFFIFSMFSKFSKLTPCSLFRDCRIHQFVEPCCEKCYKLEKCKTCYKLQKCKDSESQKLKVNSFGQTCWTVLSLILIFDGLINWFINAFGSVWLLFDVVVEKLKWPLDVVSQLSVRVLQGQKKQIGRQSLSFHTLCPSKTK